MREHALQPRKMVCVALSNYRLDFFFNDVIPCGLNGIKLCEFSKSHFFL